jgi:predicted O-methyltransferase YrrM
MPAASRRRIFLMRSFELWQRFGLHVTPVDYYQPIPDTRELDLSQPRAETTLEGLDLDLPGQIALLSRFRQAFQTEYEEFPRDSATDAFNGFFVENGAFGPVDAEILYCMVRDRKPRRIVEIGRGFSTLLSAAALQANSTHSLEQATFVSIDPSATDAPTALPADVTYIEERVERLPLATFDALDRSDILFIDSSHVVRFGGDVVFAILEVLPRLRPGVAVHFHDIFLPNDYPPEWITRLRRFWSEQYLLQAFLSFNSSFRVIWAGSCLHLRHRHELTGAFHSYDPQRHWPGSFWIERVR